MPRLLLISILVLVTTVPVVAQQDIAPGEIVGSYLVRHNYGGSRITLIAAGRFLHESSDCTMAYTKSGSYSLANGVLHFKVEKETARGLFDNNEVNLRDPKARKKVLGTNTSWEPTTDFELHVIKWDKRIYLIYEEGFESFVAAINLGLEPRNVEAYREYYGSMYLREGDEKKDAAGGPSLPQYYLSLLLTEPVIASILKVDPTGDEKENLVTIDRGSKHGLRMGMTMVPLEQDSWNLQHYWIVAVTYETATVRVYGEVKPGDKLTTKIKDARRTARLISVNPWITTQG